MKTRWVAAGLVVAVLTACSSTTGGGGTTTADGGGIAAGGAATTEAATTGGDPTESGGGDESRVAMVTQIEGIPYFAGFQAGAEAAAAEFGVSYTQAGPTRADSAEQRRILDGLIGQDYDAIAVSPLDATSINGNIAAATGDGIPVVTSDADAPESDREVFVSQAEDEELGAMVMDIIAEHADGEGQYAVVSGAPDTGTLNAWIDAARARQEETYPEMELVGDIRYTADSADALQEAQSLLTAFPELKGIIAVASITVPGVSQAVQNAGRVGEVAVTGFGSPATARPFIEAGVMPASVLWDVEDLGYLTVWALRQVIDGNEFEESNEVPGLDEPIAYDSETQTLLLGPPLLIDESNVGDFDF